MSEPSKSVKRRPTATALQVGGLSVASLGLGVLHLWLGLLAIGVGLVALGIALELE